VLMQESSFTRQSFECVQNRCSGRCHGWYPQRMRWEPRGRSQAGLTGAKEAGAWESVCAWPREESPEEPALQPLATKPPRAQKHTRKFPFFLHPLPLPSVSGRQGGRQVIWQETWNFVLLFPPPNSARSHQTRTQLPQLHTRSARDRARGRDPEVPWSGITARSCKQTAAARCRLLRGGFHAEVARPAASEAMHSSGTRRVFYSSPGTSIPGGAAAAAPAMP